MSPSWLWSNPTYHDETSVKYIAGCTICVWCTQNGAPFSDWSMLQSYSWKTSPLDRPTMRTGGKNIYISLWIDICKPFNLFVLADVHRAVISTHFFPLPFFDRRWCMRRILAKVIYQYKADYIFSIDNHLYWYSAVSCSKMSLLKITFHGSYK